MKIEIDPFEVVELIFALKAQEIPNVPIINKDGERSGVEVKKPDINLLSVFFKLFEDKE